MSSPTPAEALLSPPRPSTEAPPLTRPNIPIVDDERFTVPKNRSYQQQYSDTYFLRLCKIKPTLEKLATEAWSGTTVNGRRVRRVDRVLDVRQGEVCWVIGTVYHDMPLKPNILEEISRDYFSDAPPKREKYYESSAESQNVLMLEDASGRLKLSAENDVLHAHDLVTGVMCAVLGTENAKGEFVVLDVQVPGLPPQQKVPDGTSKGKVCLVSGLAMSGERDSLAAHLLADYLLGESGNEEDTEIASQIVRLIIAGDSIGKPALPTPPPETSEEPKKEMQKKIGRGMKIYDPAPNTTFDAWLSSILPSIPVTILPGATDPANATLPQQPLHPAIFPTAKAFPNLHRATNPVSFTLNGVSFLGTGGQNLDDVYRYVEEDDRANIMERMLSWRCIAPTAPDTLWCFPFQGDDPFTITEAPDVFFCGAQKKGGLGLEMGLDGSRTRCVVVPRFQETAEVILLDLETKDCEVVRFEVDL